MNYITQEQAHEMGAKGAPATEAERLLFEAWMKGHCWEVEGKWSGRTYIGERVYDGSMITRMLWAVWRDRAALAQPAKPEQPEQAECGNTPYDEGPFTIAQPAKPVEQPAQPDCRTCYHLRMGYCRVFHRGFVCTNGDKYEAAPAVVLWRTE